jgi:hypothetical protein
MPSLHDYPPRLLAAVDAMRDLGPALAAGEPWPLTDVYGPGPESSWGPREVLAHCAEFLPYWMGEIERILDGATDGEGVVRFGRTEEDALRIQIIGRDRQLPARELLSRIVVSAARIARRMEELSDADAERYGLHPTRGQMDVRAIVDRHIVDHLERHLDQLREILGAAAAEPTR